MTKGELEKRMFAHRKLLETFAAGKYAQAKSETVTVDEIVKFLQLSASGHKRIYRYTNTDRLKEMLSTKRLSLSRLLEMNDLREYQDVKDADRIYIACFSFGKLENMAMWMMYGRDTTKSLRVSFDNKRIQKCIGNLKSKKGIFKDACGKESISEDSIESVSFHDIAYVYGTALMWNHKIVGMSRCRDLSDPKKVEKLQTYIKDYGWASENEVRLLIKLKKCDPELKRIYIDFESAIKSLEVVVGPRDDKCAKIKGLLSMYGLNSVNESTASLIF
jgi:hypothetical protein